MQPSPTPALLLVGLLIWHPSGVAAQELARPAASQAVPAADVLALLQSSNPREQAWGAWIAGRDVMRDMIPPLQKLIASRLGTTTFPDMYVMDIALDALIQLRATVPPEAAMWVYDRRQPQALILLSMAGPAGDGALLRIAASEQGLPWYVAANVLLSRKTSGLGALLLDGLQITVVASESGNTGRAVGGSSMVGDGVSGPTPGFPPIAHYRLTTGSRPGSVVVSNGPRAVYYERTVSQPGRGPMVNTLQISGPTDDERLAYIAALLDTDRSQLPIRAYESRAVPPRGAPGHQAALDEARSDVTRRYEILVRQMVEKSALTSVEVASLGPPRVNVEIR